MSGGEIGRRYSRRKRDKIETRDIYVDQIVNKLSYRFESCPDYNMNDFIKLIKIIGFIEKRSDFVDILCYEYNHYFISINRVSERWSITEHNNLLDIENQINFSIDDIRLIESHFKSEIRNNLLISIGV